MKAYYPVNLDIEGKKCVVVGGGAVAERKIRTLLDFGAKVHVFSPKATPGIIGLAKRKKIRLVMRRYKRCDLDQAALAIAATDDRGLNRKISVEAKRKCVLVNVIDEPKLCTFIAPSVVKRGPLVISISTSGQAPALSKALRIKLEKIVPPQLGSLALELGRIRRARKKN